MLAVVVMWPRSGIHLHCDAMQVSLNCSRSNCIYLKQAYLASICPNAQLVKRVNGFEKYKKWAKVHPCFSFNKPTKQNFLHFLGWSRPKFCTKLFSPDCWKESFAKIMVNVQKRLKGASAEANLAW